ncbi:MAG: DUF5678 domain-containing protein [bacterium]
MTRVAATRAPKTLLNQLMAATADDSRWLARNYAMLLEHYPERFVAVFNKKVVASHQDISELMKLVDKRLPNAGKLVSTEYITDKKAMVIL